MNGLTMPAWLSGLKGNASKGIAAPVIIIMLLAMMVLPLPAFILDIFFSFNIKTVCNRSIIYRCYL